MYVTSGSDASGRELEVRVTLEALVDLVNLMSDAMAGSDPVNTREVLNRHEFTRARDAPDAEVTRLTSRFGALLEWFDSIPEGSVDDTIEWVNGEIDHLPIAPSLVVHDGAPLHIHWTPQTATFDDQVIADMLMALAQELCDHGVRRFGRCAASDCRHLYYDATRNGSRRFCSDPRCASRTHTARHRARQRHAG